MPKTQLPFTNGFYMSRSLPVSAQECKNLYVHIVQKGGLANEVLYGTPGTHELATSGTSLHINRGSWVMNGIPYFVNGTALYRLNRIISASGDETFTLDSLGTIPGTTRVSMADNGTQLCVLVPGGNGYIWVEDTTTFTQITDGDFTANGNPQHVVFIDGYFLFTTDTKKFIISALNDGLNYLATDVGTAEADPDDIVAPIVLGNDLYIAGDHTLEPFRNQPVGAAFPFIRIDGAIESVGVAAQFSLIKSSSAFFFIGGGENDEPSIYQFDGSMSIVSDDGIDNILGALTEAQLSAVFSWSYSQGGSRFVGWTLPTTTIVYELVSKRWHERKSFDIIDSVSAEFRWRANSVVKAYNRILIGDNQDGRIGSVDLDFYDEYDQNILRSVATMPFSNLGERLLVPMIELTMESGTGNFDDPEPKIRMERSVDGKTWYDSRTRNIGKVGEFKKRAIWRRNGRAARLELFRFLTSAKVKIVMAKLEANIK